MWLGSSSLGYLKWLGNDIVVNKISWMMEHILRIHLTVAVCWVWGCWVKGSSSPPWFFSFCWGQGAASRSQGEGKETMGGRNLGVAILPLIYNVVCVPCSSTCHLLAMCTLLACSSKAVLGTLVTVTNGGHGSSLLSFLSLTCVAKTSMAFSNCKVQSE